MRVRRRLVLPVLLRGRRGDEGQDGKGSGRCRRAACRWPTPRTTDAHSIGQFALPSKRADVYVITAASGRGRPEHQGRPDAGSRSTGRRRRTPARHRGRLPRASRSTIAGLQSPSSASASSPGSSSPGTGRDVRLARLDAAGRSASCSSSSSHTAACLGPHPRDAAGGTDVRVGRHHATRPRLRARVPAASVADIESARHPTATVHNEGMADAMLKLSEYSSWSPASCRSSSPWSATSWRFAVEPVRSSRPRERRSPAAGAGAGRVRCAAPVQPSDATASRSTARTLSRLAFSFLTAIPGLPGHAHGSRPVREPVRVLGRLRLGHARGVRLLRAPLPRADPRPVRAADRRRAHAVRDDRRRRPTDPLVPRCRTTSCCRSTSRWRSSPTARSPWPSRPASSTCPARRAAGAACRSRELLDEISYRAVVIGFPLLTLTSSLAPSGPRSRGARTGAGTPRRPRRSCTWLIYGAYLHARVVRGWRGRRAALLLIARLRRGALHLLRQPLLRRPAQLRRLATQRQLQIRPDTRPPTESSTMTRSPQVDEELAGPTSPPGRTRRTSAPTCAAASATAAGAPCSCSESPPCWSSGAAYLVNRPADDAGVRAVTLSGPRHGAPPEIGKQAQDFTATTVDGREVSLSDYRGKAVWLDLRGQLVRSRARPR